MPQRLREATSTEMRTPGLDASSRGLDQPLDRIKSSMPQLRHGGQMVAPEDVYNTAGFRSGEGRFAAREL